AIGRSAWTCKSLCVPSGSCSSIARPTEPRDALRRDIRVTNQGEKRMPHRLRPSPLSSLRPVCLAVALAGVSGACAAEESPYYIGASQTFTRDSNVFRQSEGGLVVHDYYSSTGLLGGIDKLFGRCGKRARRRATASALASASTAASRIDRSSSPQRSIDAATPRTSAVLA